MSSRPDLLSWPLRVALLYLLGTVLTCIVLLGLAGRFFGKPYVAWLSSLVGGEAGRGFLIGVCSGLPLVGVAVWLLGRRTHATLTPVGWASACTVLATSAFPLVVLLPPRYERNVDPHGTQRLIERTLPGVQQGAVTIFLVAALCLGLAYALRAPRTSRRR